MEPGDLNRSSTLADINLRTAASLIACGIDPKRSILFAQSSVQYHTELSWVLSCATPLNWINRMTQYKQKKDEGMLASLGLYSYPVLMAADILLYNAQLVPVGEDQTLHMELVRQLADRMNSLFAKPFFNRPEVFSAPYVTEYRVKDLQDGTIKMSKSNRSQKGTLYLDDTEMAVKQKIAGAYVDGSSKKVVYDEKKKPGLANLMRIYASLNDIKNIKEIEARLTSIDQLKSELSQKLIEM